MESFFFKNGGGGDRKEPHVVNTFKTRVPK